MILGLYPPCLLQPSSFPASFNIISQAFQYLYVPEGNGIVEFASLVHFLAIGCPSLLAFCQLQFAVTFLYLIRIIVYVLWILLFILGPETVDFPKAVDSAGGGILWILGYHTQSDSQTARYVSKIHFETYYFTPHRYQSALHSIQPLRMSCLPCSAGLQPIVS